MDLFKFNPPNRIIYLKNAPYELGAFSLRITLLVNVKYGSLKAFNDILKNEEKAGTLSAEFLDCMIWLSYNLLIDKKLTFKKYLKIFNKQIKKDATCIITIIKTIKDSYPLEKTTGTSTKKSTKEDNFAELYVHVSSAIKFTPDEFYELTSRQIYHISSEIIKAKNKDFEFQCSLHGAKVEKPKDNRPASEINFTPEENIQMSEIIKSRQEQLKRERGLLYN